MRFFKHFGLGQTQQTVALASAVSFGMQVVFALLMLRLFTPQDVGTFSVVSQIAFFWMTLALSQAPLTLLANAYTPAHTAARAAWHSSMRRGAFLLPLALVALWLSQLTVWPTFLWVIALAFFQMSWQLAQSFVLRVGSPQQQAWVRVVPPLCAAVVACVGAGLAWSGPTLLLSALLGYAWGACWLLAAWQDNATGEVHDSAQRDQRSTRLRLLHTLVDALLATAIVVVWQRLYGAQETGWMSALLRVLGFVPAVVHMAWAQVNLAHATQDEKNHLNSGRMALLACLSVCALCALCALALHWQWLATEWLGVWPYLVPMALWQASASLTAAYSHRPFQVNQASRYSLACMAVAGVQALVLLAPMLLDLAWLDSAMSPTTHFLVFACTSAVGLLGLALWMRQLRD